MKHFSLFKGIWMDRQATGYRENKYDEMSFMKTMDEKCSLNDISFII
jgi:hypothetical protein